jgi:glucose-1-phosphate cytidylyltransferase
MKAGETPRPYPVIILCGGIGLRMQEITDGMPKALVSIGHRPVLWHVMKIYSRSGFRDFILPLGYGGEQIIAWFERYLSMAADFTLRLGDGSHHFHAALPEDEQEWTITFVHAGEQTQTGGRLKRCRAHVGSEHVLATYVDGLTDADIGSVLEQHHADEKDVTLLSVSLPTTFGVIESAERMLLRFDEKPHTHCKVNGGFFVFRSSVLDEIRDDTAVLERDVLPELARAGRAGVFEHRGFWHCMDTPKHVDYLNRLWSTGEAPWKWWND